MSNPQIILASQSKARNAMLRDAGVTFTAQAADVDENAIIKEMQQATLEQEKVVQKLADEKALRISQQNRDALVIGSDQILLFKNAIMQKAKNEADARERLGKMSGRQHHLLSAVSVVKNNEVLWQHIDEAELTMHDFDDEFLDDYCARAGDALLKSVGGYYLEAHGAWLFKEIKGNFFTILGMPLLPLLTYLREEQGASL